MAAKAGLRLAARQVSLSISLARTTAVPTALRLQSCLAQGQKRNFRIAARQQQKQQPKTDDVQAATTSKEAEPPSTPLEVGVAYSELTVGVPKEVFPGERRVAMTPANVARLKKAGFKDIRVEKSAGSASEFRDEDYVQAGATIVDNAAELCMCHPKFNPRRPESPTFDAFARQIAMQT